ncbi:MAG: DUF58 domain-containing protein [Thermoplasmata archaeon]|nr:DUF58 domain-containing protein [Thermoplasmata archaeon]
MTGDEAPWRWRTPALLLLGAGALLAGLSIYRASAPILVLAIAFLLAPLGALATAPSAGVEAQMEWTSSGSGREVGVQGRLTLPPGVSVEGLDLAFYPPEPLRERAAPRIRRRPGEVQLELSWYAEFPCMAVLALPMVSWTDPLGLIEVPVSVQGTALRLERFPPETARIRARYLRRTTVFPGEVPSRQRGSGGDFFAIRQSAVGDTPRQINWPATARVGRLMANEFLRERTGDLLVVLDLRPTPLGPRLDAEVLSMTRAAVLGIATAFLNEKARVGLALFDEYVTAVPLGSGRLQRFRIRAALQDCRVGSVAGPAERLAVALGRYFPRGIGCLVLSTLSDDEGPLMLAHLRRRGFDPFVLSPSVLPLILPPEIEQDRAERLAARLFHLARRRRLAAAWEEAPVIEWEEYWSLAPLVRYLSRPPPRRTGIG